MLTVEYLCKWRGLPYIECTWEESDLISMETQAVIDEYLKRNNSDCVPARSAKLLKNRPKFRIMKEQPPRLGKGRDLVLRDYQLDGLNWLAYAWCKYVLRNLLCGLCNLQVRLHNQDFYIVGTTL